MIGADPSENDSPGPSLPAPLQGPVDSKAVVHWGILTLIRKATFGNSHQKRRVILCAPTVTEDFMPILVQMFPDLTTTAVNALRPSPHTTNALGRITQAAIKATPLLIILPAVRPSDGDIDVKPAFLEIASIEQLKDEVELNDACTFSLEIKGSNRGNGLGKNLRLRAAFSVDYLAWIAVLREAMSFINGRPGNHDALPFTEPTTNITRPMTHHSDADLRKYQGALRNVDWRATMIRHSEMDLKEYYASGIARGFSIRNSELDLKAMYSDQNSGLADANTSHTSTSVPQYNPQVIPTQPHTPNQHTLNNKPDSGTSQFDCRMLDSRPPPAVYNKHASPNRLPSLRRVSWHGERDEASVSDLARNWEMPLLAHERRATTEPKPQAENEQPENLRKPTPPVSYNRSMRDDPDAIRPLSRDSGLGSSRSSFQLPGDQVPSVGPAEARRKWRDISNPEPVNGNERTTGHNRRHASSIDALVPPTPPYIPTHSASFPSAAHGRRSLFPAKPASKYHPVTLPGSPLGPPSELPSKPIISLADARGPRVWSVKKKRWVELHKKVAVNNE